MFCSFFKLVISQFIPQNTVIISWPGHWQVHLAFPVIPHTAIATVGMFRPSVGGKTIFEREKVSFLFAVRKKCNPTQHGGIYHTNRPFWYQPWNIIFVFFFNCYELDESQSVGTNMAPNPRGAGGSKYEFLRSFFFPFLFIASFFFFLLLKKGREKETSTDVSSQWRQSWCGGEEVNVEVSHRERGMPLPEGIWGKMLDTQSVPEKR